MIKVQLGADWRRYTTRAPGGASVLGTVTRDGADSGALVQFLLTGLFFQVNAGVLRSLPQAETAAAIAAARIGTVGGPGRGQGRRPEDGKRGTRRLVMLDDDTADALRELGGGNLSLGIRLAAEREKLKECQENEQIRTCTP